MLKIALAVMLLATSAFAGANLEITSPQQSAPGQLKYDAARTVTLNLQLIPTEGSVINGVSLYAVGTTPGALHVARNMPAVGTAVLDTPLASISANALIETVNDLGVRSDPATEGVTGPVSLMTLVLTVDQSVASTTPVTLVLSGYWADTEFNEGEIPAQSFTITPEPASMLLLAAGAAFFARRRRA